jgi:hypothetical protein
VLLSIGGWIVWLFERWIKWHYVDVEDLDDLFDNREVIDDWHRASYLKLINVRASKTGDVKSVG